ncbi:amino acid permease [Reticulibacter mediterranei]|uniref:Amino acid permease n=1 Tax=Reticulibacter mediterranei TaxID=2778369 RepID=A0A8J3IPH0_9CHLR|nr:APC family permease [Reticulibacter mediterranei]GHO95419.1 amino acid permease [Reticulibacter mediterranei]
MDPEKEPSLEREKVQHTPKDHHVSPGNDDFDLSAPVMEELRGSRLGSVRVRIVRPQHPTFRRTTEGVLVATERASTPEGRVARSVAAIKRVLIGPPLATAMAEQERLTKIKALAVLSSDAISSVAYATEAILINLVAAGSLYLGLTFPISLVIIALLIIVAISYRQTIPAYPGGGGSYIVAKENLGTLAGLIAAAALLIDYVLNVAVSVAAGVHNLVSLFGSLAPYVVPLDVALVLLITVVNLRGVRESGNVLALPTYFFVGSALLLIVVGIFNAFVIHHQPLIGQFAPVKAIEPLSIFLILRSFATGCSAMTGVEAISNGIPAFQKPETRNAAITLTWMAGILGTLFFGITVLAMTYAVQANQDGNPTVIALIAGKVFTGPLWFLFPIFQLATLGILTLSAETSYSDFPRLASLLARDRFLPTQFAFKGDRLAFSVGIVVLAVLASLLLIVFQGNTNQLINLFAVGVFISFTLSQGGMVFHWWRLRQEQKGWLRSMLVNGVGAVTTLLVALIISITKFVEGAWIIVLLIPVLVLTFRAISAHYHYVERERTTDLPLHPQDVHHRLIVPIDRLDRVAIQSLAYARSISPQVTAVHVAIDEGEAEQMRIAWDDWQKHLSEKEETHLLVIESPYRSLIRPLMAYIDTIHERHPDETLTVLLPEFVVAHWWEYFLHNQTALRLKAALFFRPGIVVINMPLHLQDRPRAPKHR